MEAPMSEMTDAEVGKVDLAVVAYRDQGDWYVQELPPASIDSIESIGRELRRYPGESGALAMISVDEDFVLLIRAQGAMTTVLLSDASAATDWTLARSAVDHLGVHVEVDDEEVPAGDLAIVADLGLSAADMGARKTAEERWEPSSRSPCSGSSACHSACLNSAALA